MVISRPCQDVNAQKCTKMSNASAGCAEGTANAIIKSILFNGGYFAYYQTVKA